MDYDFYLEKFRNSFDYIDKELLTEKQLEIDVGITLDSVVLKLYKKQWASDKADPINAKTRIFFAIWVNDKTIKQEKIFYNIHALKLRKLKGYSIVSREFADKFRRDFKKTKTEWENVSLKFGPLTLMEGWNKLDVETVENTILNLANKFIKIEYLIDKTLKNFENPNRKTETLTAN